MNPRRLIYYAVVLLVLLGAYVGLRWHQAQKEAREQQAKQVFDFKEAEISALTLKRGKQEIQLTRQGAAWEITKPLKAKADKLTVDNLVRALAGLKMERDLGPGDFKTFGLDQPQLVVSFTAKGKPYQLALGQAAPGSRGFYVRKDQAPNILLIASGAKNSLDQQLTSLRDKTLWIVNPGEVKALRIRTGKTKVHLEKSGANAWRWVGRPDFKVRADRVAQLLRELSEARITEFPPSPPKDLKAAGLAPQAKIEVTITNPKGTQTLLLGTQAGPGLYARLGAQAPVVQVNQTLAAQITRGMTTIEDHRLFSGAITEVEVAVWGTPGKFWTAIPDKSGNFWKITGPDKAELKQTPPQVEMALINFQNLEYSSLLPKAGAPGKDAFSFELFGRDGQQMVHLDELEKKADSVKVLIKSGKTTFGAVVPSQKYDQWRAELVRLTTPPPKPAK
jgi:hypothetical protein